MILQPTPNGAMQQLDAAVEAALIENRRHFLRFLTRRLGTVDAAEEVLQQFYLRAVSKAFHLRKRESILTWLSRLLSTVLADYARREATRRRQETAYAQQQALAQEAQQAWRRGSGALISPLTMSHCGSMAASATPSPAMAQCRGRSSGCARVMPPSCA